MSDATGTAGVRDDRPARRTVLRMLLGVFVILGVGWVTWDSIVPINSLTTKQSKAQLGCRGLAQAIEAFQKSPSNTQHALPRTLNELLQPPWGGQPFLKNGDEDLQDPWGQPYQMRAKTFEDGREYRLVFTHAPDGTAISQFGIGTQSRLAD